MILFLKELIYFVLAFNNTTENDDDNPINNIANIVFFLPRVDITSYDILINGNDLYDQPVNNQIKKYHESRKIATGKGDDYTTGFW